MLIIPRRKATTTDPYFSSVSLLLGRNGTAIVDKSPRTKTITNLGSTQIVTTLSRFSGGFSVEFNQNGKILRIPSDIDFTFPGAFTLEFWIYWNAVPAAYNLITLGSSGITQMFVTTLANGSGLRWGLTGVAEYATAPLTWTTGRWYNVVVQRDAANFIDFFVDFNRITNGTPANSISYSGGIDINSSGSGSVSFANCNIDENYRLTKGVARYANGTRANAGKMVFADTNDLAVIDAPFPAA
jgi:hypothetical protein